MFWIFKEMHAVHFKMKKMLAIVFCVTCLTCKMGVAPIREFMYRFSPSILADELTGPDHMNQRSASKKKGAIQNDICYIAQADVKLFQSAQAVEALAFIRGHWKAIGRHLYRRPFFVRAPFGACLLVAALR